jgi:RNA polymerase sigma-70 factor, ECF subfamily
MDAGNVPQSGSLPRPLSRNWSQGDDEAMANLIGRHYGASIRMANSILRNHSGAEDVVQTAYSQAFQKLHMFPGRGSFSTWITRIVVNQSLVHLRSKSRATLLSLEEPMNERTKLFLATSEPTPEQSTARREISTAISRALARLPDNLRTPYKLHAISRMLRVDIATRLGLSLSATKSRIFRARCTLESRLYFSCGPAHY